MRNRLLPFMLCVGCAALAAGAPAHAGPAFDLKAVLQALGPATPVPPEWDGVWDATDSVFTCDGELSGVSTSSDTLCGGKDIPAPGGIDYVCSGTADATSMHLTCTYGFDPIPDCHASYVMRIDGTLTGDTFSYVATDSTTYSGTGFGCDLLPPACSVIHVHGVRTGPAPTEYCATATLPTTWGRIREIFR
jgi:hypothetical protein